MANKGGSYETITMLLPPVIQQTAWIIKQFCKKKIACRFIISTIAAFLDILSSFRMYGNYIIKINAHVNTFEDIFLFHIKKTITRISLKVFQDITSISLNYLLEVINLILQNCMLLALH